MCMCMCMCMCMWQARWHAFHRIGRPIGMVEIGAPAGDVCALHGLPFFGRLQMAADIVAWHRVGKFVGGRNFGR